MVCHVPYIAQHSHITSNSALIVAKCILLAFHELNKVMPNNAVLYVKATFAYFNDGIMWKITKD